MAEASRIGLEFPGQFDLGPALPQQIGHLCRNSIGTGRSLAEKYKDRNEQLDRKQWDVFRLMMASENGLLAIKLGNPAFVPVERFAELLRVCAADVPVPMSDPLEDAAIPNVARIIAGVRQALQ